LSRGGVERFLLAVMPADLESAAIRIYERSVKKIGAWFRSQLLLSIIVGGLVLVTLLLLDVRYAFLIAVLTAVFELMPFIGPIISGSVAILAALTTSPELALYVLIAFVVIHQIENHVLVPLLVGRGVGLHPVIVIIALLIGAEIGGLLGVIISVPAAVVFQEIVEDRSEEKQKRSRKRMRIKKAAAAA
jgi:predicted PurR-regulated permease PerM